MSPKRPRFTARLRPMLRAAVTGVRFEKRLIAALPSVEPSLPPLGTPSVFATKPNGFAIGAQRPGGEQRELPVRCSAELYGPATGPSPLIHDPEKMTREDDHLKSLLSAYRHIPMAVRILVGP